MFLHCFDLGNYYETLMKVGLESTVVLEFLKEYSLGAYSDKEVTNGGYILTHTSIDYLCENMPYIPKGNIIKSLFELNDAKLIGIYGGIYSDKFKSFSYITNIKICKDAPSIKEHTKAKCEPKKKTEGYVYVLKCADKYKLGYSNNVEQRMKQLDTRPFPLELVYKAYSEKAYDIEQELHSVYTSYGYRLEGEWYSSDLPVKELIENIDYLVADGEGTDEAWDRFEEKYPKYKDEATSTNKSEDKQEN